MPSNTLTVAEMKKLIKAEMNVLIMGPSGVGKTYITHEAVASLGLKLKVLNAPTLDPYAHLIGIPVPNDEEKTVDFRRPSDLYETEVIFIDEANRASDPTLNALLEITQFGSINGEKLPNLKCVVAAMNPPTSGYKVNEIDVALLDRFDAYFDLEPEANRNYFVTKYGADFGRAIVTFWEQYEASRIRQRNSQNKIGYLSPRKLERIVDSYVDYGLTSASIPPNVAITVTSIRKTFGPFLKKSSPRKAVPTSTNNSKGSPEESRDVRRGGSNAEAYIIHRQKSDESLDFVMNAIKSGINSAKLADSQWNPVYELLGRDRCKKMFDGWNETKKNTFLADLDSSVYYNLFV